MVFIFTLFGVRDVFIAIEKVRTVRHSFRAVITVQRHAVGLKERRADSSVQFKQP